MSVGVPSFDPPPVGDEGIAVALTEGRPAMIVERPDIFGSRRARAPLEVSGWAWSGAGIEAVVVGIDGDVHVEALHDLFRRDLRALFGDDLATSGFAVRVDPREWPPGPHELTVVAIDRDGRAIGVSGTVEALPAAPPRSSPVETIDPLSDDASFDERLVPSVHRGEALAPEHHARYRWAAEVVAGRRVLDAGCGTGSGAAQLAAHAREVTGIDLSPRAVATAARDHGHAATFREGDLLDLPFRDGEFDAVVCFETIEQVRDTERALDEIRRVMAPQGLLLLSSANRGVYPAGNPLHLHELTADELQLALRARFGHVALHHQQAHLASLLCDQATLQHDDPTQPIQATTAKAAATTPQRALYTVATATDGRPPDHPSHQLALGSTFHEEEQRRLIAAWQEHCVDVETENAELRSNARLQQHAVAARRERHAEAEAAMAARIAAAERELASTREAAKAMTGSLSWRVTAPLRMARRGVGRVRGRGTGARPS